MEDGREGAAGARVVVTTWTEKPGGPAVSASARQALANLYRAVDAFTEAERAYSPQDPGAYNRAALTVHLLNLAMLECEHAGVPDDDLRRRLYDVRRTYGRSTFVCRLQTWPRGYPGDWETIDYLLDGINRTAESEFAHQLERYALWCAAAQQHRNKVAFQTALGSHALSSNPSAKILSIACGGSRDLAALTDRAPSFRGTLVLNDADESALGISRERLSAFDGRCTFVPGNALELKARVGPLGPYDLILAGGLFDYLTDGIAVRLLRTAHREYLEPGGTFYFTNIATGNPYRLWMGVIGSWTLIERTEEDVRRLCMRAGVPDTDVDLARDTSGLAWLVRVRRRADRWV